jgi:hypothetical protein
MMKADERSVGVASGSARRALVALLLLCAAGAALAASATAPRGATAAAAAVPAVRTVHLSFRALGASGPFDLRGAESSADLAVGIRADEVVTGARLHLRVTHSPALIEALSHLRIRVNGQTVAAVPLTRAEADREVMHEVVLDPQYFTDYNHLRFDLIGHYTLECEDPQHSSLWATIGDASELELELRPLELRDDLALLPAPFLDRHDNRRLELPIVLPGTPSRSIERSAGIVASWFGVEADYRAARFPVSFDALPPSHALVFATNGHVPAGLTLPVATGPSLSIVDHPADPHLKLLVFMGRDDAELEQAVQGFVTGQAVLAGPSATIRAVHLERRAAYDAPRWLPTDRLVRFGELVDGAAGLEAYGHVPAPLALRVRLPPDLLTWNRPGVPLDLRYRFTPPPENDASTLTVGINGQLVRVFRLKSESGAQSLGRLVVPAVLGSAEQDTEQFLIPAFRVGAVNTLEFQFALDLHYQGACRVMPRDTVRESLDPDSTIDLRGFHHYAALPDLALFANAGFPFTRYADLAETAIVLPDPVTAASLEQLYATLGRLGRATGAAATQYRLIDEREARSARDLDLLVLGGAAANQLLAEWRQDATLVLGSGDRRFRDFGPVPRFTTDPLRFGAAAPLAGEVTVATSGSLGALIGFESPLSAGRSVVALVGSDPAAVRAVSDALDDAGSVAAMRGELALVRGGTVRSYEGGHVYYVGTLPWWTRAWFHLSRHPLLLTLLALIVAVTVAVWIYAWLQRRATRRLDGGTQ